MKDIWEQKAIFHLLSAGSGAYPPRVDRGDLKLRVPATEVDRFLDKSRRSAPKSRGRQRPRAVPLR